MTASASTMDGPAGTHCGPGSARLFYGDTRAALRAGQRAALRAGLRAALRAGPPAALCAGPTRAPGACSRSEPTAVRTGIGLGLGDPRVGSDSDSADWSLHTAGPDNPDRATRLHPLWPAAIGSGPGRRRRGGVGQSGMDLAEGGDCS
jgi:hypothetical protein